MPTLRPRIVLADDHRILLDAIQSLVEPEFNVVGTFEDAESLLADVRRLAPDAVVLDIGMPRMNGLLAAEQLRRVVPRSKIIFLTMDRDIATAAEAFRLGAHGYILKNAAGAELIGAIREVLRGGYYASPAMTAGIDGSFVQTLKQMPRRAELTSRQKAVLQLLREGNSMKRVGEILDITPRTVAFHKYSIMEQFAIRSNADLMRFADSVLPAKQS